MTEASFPSADIDVGRRAMRIVHPIARHWPTKEMATRVGWQAISLIYWIGSDIPRPELPAREPKLPPRVGLAGEAVIGGLDRIRRRLWLRYTLAIMVRSCWLVLAVACGSVAIGFAGGPSPRWEGLVWIGCGFLTFGIVLGLLGRPGRHRTARMLDRSFSLKERLTTALEHLGQGLPVDGARAAVVYLQVADAANAMLDLRRQKGLGVKLPVGEFVLVVFWGLVLAALFFVRGVGGGLPDVMAGALPSFVPAVERPAAPEPQPLDPGADATQLSAEEIARLSEQSATAHRDLQELARALDDHAVTRSAADALTRGDYDAAAEELRDLAPLADQLSPAAREELAHDLDEATNNMSPGEGSLSEATSEAAAGLREGDESARQGMRDLGDAVEQTGNEIASPEELAGRPSQGEGAPGRQGEGGATETGDGSSGSLGDLMEAMQNQGEGEGSTTGQGGATRRSRSGESESRGENAGEQGAAGQTGPPGTSPNQLGSGEPGAQPGDSSQQGVGSDDNRGEGPQSERGAGAGSGESSPDGLQGGAAQAPGDTSEQDGVASESPIEGTGTEAEPNDVAEVTNLIQLPTSSGGEAIPTGGDSGSASRGSGSGEGGGTGTAVQGEVGDAGPDSNRVPPDYREVVERYFSDSTDG